MTEGIALAVALAAALGLVAVAAAAGVGLVIFLVRRNAGQAADLRETLRAVAQRHGLAFEPGDALRSPSVTGVVGGQTVTLTYGTYRMGSGGRVYRYTQAVGAAPPGVEALLAERGREQHVEAVGGVEVAIADARLGATHAARGWPAEAVAALLTPAHVARYRQCAVSHVRLGGGRVLVQRPGHHAAEGDVLALLRLTADLRRGAT